MKGISPRILAGLMALLLIFSSIIPTAFASETDDAVAAVTAQLEAIDTLQQMQDNRSDYKATGSSLSTNDTNRESHAAAQAGYKKYVTEMFSARIAAQLAYDALTGDQKAQISPALVAKLSNDLPTVLHSETFSVSSSNDAYVFESIGSGKLGYSYEVGHHKAFSIPQLFILVDTDKNPTSWTPSGKYEYGKSNFEVTYCCDAETGLAHGVDYKRINLEDSSYYGPNAARHIRAILQNSYPYLSIDAMKAKLKAGGLNSEFVDSLNRGDIITAVQMAIWNYANADNSDISGTGYLTSHNVKANSGVNWYTAMHDYTNEIWDWLPPKGAGTYDAEAEYRVNTLIYYLCNLPGQDPNTDDILITNVEVARAELAPRTDGYYDVGVRAFLNTGANSGDNLTLTVSSSSGSKTSLPIGSKTRYEASIRAKIGDTITVVVEGTQYVDRNVYFYEPRPTSDKNERNASQNLVGVAEGKTKVRTEKEFTFEQDIVKGLRIYKSALGTDLPISGIPFSVYKVEPVEGESIGSMPTPEDVAKYATTENLVGTAVTDENGYATIAVENNGTYLVVETHIADKVKDPVAPFFITIPSPEENYKADQDGIQVAEIEWHDIVSVYPKNVPVVTPEPTPIIPKPPAEVKGQFTIVKHDSADSSIKLEGAVFDVYRPATSADEVTKNISFEGVDYSVVKVETLTTGANGTATSSSLPCGPYFLVETKSPDGYNLTDEVFKVEVVSKELTSTTIVNIGNERGHTLPETGGTGTTRMMMAGLMLIAAAFIALAARKSRFSAK